MHGGFTYKIYVNKKEPKVYIAPNTDIALLLSSKVVNDTETSNLKILNGLDFELGGFYGIQIPKTDGASFIEGGYSLGLLDISRNRQDKFSVKNSSIKIRFHAAFNI